ncbi:MAG: hypothetical protein V4450_16825 [Bacteroidota bacterium]
MNPVTKQQSRLIGLLLVAGTIGLLLLMHVTSAPQQRCGGETTEIGLLKLI